jgi:PKD repeat protein
VKTSKHLLVGVGALLILALAVGLAFASDSAPTEEPETSPFFEATLQQAVDELDGKASPQSAGLARSASPEQAYYTDDAQLWPECAFGYTRDLTRWPWCHFTSDASRWPDACTPPWPTEDYTWDHNLWPNACEPGITQDPSGWWCNPEYTTNPDIPQCNSEYTNDPTGATPWCDPLYTWDAARYPNCTREEPYYTYASVWPECNPQEFTSDPFRWAECHYTSDSLTWPECVPAQPTWDYTSSPAVWKWCPGPAYTQNPQNWPWCDPTFTSMPNEPPCEAYTYDGNTWPWCFSWNYTTDPRVWHECHYTSEPSAWEECYSLYPTKDYTFDANLWPECDGYTYNGNFMCGPAYTYEAQVWPWCDPAWTWDMQTWPQCEPGYTNSSAQWPQCDGSTQYTNDPSVWEECNFMTADPAIWPECHYTSDPESAACDGTWFPTKDYTTDTELWPRDCGQLPGDLGDAPDDTNHSGSVMTAYPGVNAIYPVVFDPAAGLPQGPKHWQPRADAWLGPTVTLEFDADLLPDQDVVTNIDPPSDTPDRDKGDDGVNVPVPAPHCERTWFTYTVTIPPGSVGMDRYVNVWFDWTQDGDWLDTPYCPPPIGHNTSEWAVQNQLIPSGLPPGTYVFATPVYVAWFPQPADPEEIWMRISIAEQTAPLVPGTSMADGRGPANGYQYGETEDYFFKPSCPTPVADFAWDPPTICPTTTVQFWDTSSSAVPILTWSWDFGDGLGTSSVQNPTYTYSAAGVGTYDVSLTVRNVCGSDTVTKTLTVTECTTQEKDYDIYVKDSTADDGSVPSSSPWWLSPDIWVRNNVADDCATETTHQNPVPGTQNKICVRVRNRMTEAVTSTTVNVYWASASLGLSWPGSFNYVDHFTIPSLAGGAEAIDSVVWNVPYITGHFCLLARADAPDDPIGSGPDTVSPVDLVYNNNNIAQKNANIVDYPEVQTCGFYTTTVYTDVVYFDAVNTQASAIQADIEFDSSDFPLGEGTLIIDPGSLWGDCDLTNFDTVGTTLIPTAFPATMGNCDMLAHETVRMTMTVAAEIDIDFAIDVEEKVNGASVGGIQYVRDLPRCIYLPIIVKDWSP